MKENNRIVKNVFQVAISNCTTILSGVIVGFIVPKILDITGYGLYKTFTLYAGYLGLFSLGIIDGIVLEYGGIDYENIDVKKFRSYFIWYAIINCLFAVLIVCTCFFVSNRDLIFIIVMLAINLIGLNISGYFQQISQITQRFKEFSLRKILQSFFSIIIVLVLMFLYLVGVDIKYEIYVISIVVMNVLLALWYIHTYKQIIFGDHDPLRKTIHNLMYLIKIGVPLLIANLCASLIFALDRQFVNMLFNTETYAVYAFAYNLLALVTITISSISTVIYPYLKRIDMQKMEDILNIIISSVLVMVFMACIGYFPLSVFINWFLPQYIDSLLIFRIVFPGLAVSSIITIVFQNYYKALGMSRAFFIKSVCILFLSFILNAIAYFLFRTTISISIASIITMFIWFLYLESWFEKNLKYKGLKNRIYIILITLIFYFASSISNNILGLMIYFVSFVFLTFIFQKKELLFFAQKYNKNNIFNK